MKKYLTGAFTLALLLGPLVVPFLMGSGTGSASVNAQLTSNPRGVLEEALIPTAEAAGGGTRSGRGGGGGGRGGRK